MTTSKPTQEMLLPNTTTTTFMLLSLLLLLHSPPLSATLHYHNRRVLHHPFFPSTLSPSQAPSLPPHPLRHSLPNLPFSSSSTPSPTSAPTTTDTDPNPFFPTYPSTPPPPLPPATTTTTTPTAIPTFPANISSLALPTSSSSPSHSSNKLVIAVVVTVAVLVLLLASFVFLRRRSHRNSSELRPLYPHDTPTSDGRPPQKLPPNSHVSQTSSEFLYLGTVAETCEFQVQPTVTVQGTSLPEVVDERVYHIKLCGSNSPELKPLPPLPKHSGSCEHFKEVEGVSVPSRAEELFNEEEFFSPGNSSRHDFVDDEEFYRGSPSMNTYNDSPGRDSDMSVEMQALAERIGAPAPPPPPPLRKAYVGPSSGNVVGPPPLLPPSGPVVMKRSGKLSKSGDQRNEEGGGGGGGGGGMKPKLKALYWDKVRASSDRVTVWDQLHPGSFQLNEEMIETLFTATGAKEGARRSIMPLLNEEYRVLDPKKSQNIAILLKALSVTEKEVCEALSEGNADALGTELLESLLKMAPTKEEERKLLEYKDESPMKLGPAEKFLRAVLDVPFPFRRVDAMLYMATFDSEVEYIRKSFDTLEAASEQLRNNRMFLKLLEAVLKTGNRMNVGTNRGDAQAFKLDTLLKLVDVKGADGKTTLLHFVVQEIIKAEGSRISPTDQGAHKQPVEQNDVELRKQGLEIVASLGGELVSVKKAAAMDSVSLSTDVTKLARGITKISEVLKLNEANGTIENNRRFSESMSAFLKKAELEIVRIQSQESTVFDRVKGLTEYFHGNSTMEEARPLRIFMVVRDFLGVLDQVCKEVGKINERTIISSVRQFPTSVNQNLQPPFPELRTTDAGDSSSDNESVIT